MRRILIAAAAALAVAGCETPTLYQPLAPSHASGGYSEQQIEPNRWQVTFTGNDVTSRERVERYLLFRTAELTVQQSFDWFQTVDRHTNRETSFFGEGDPYFGGPFGGFGGPFGGFGYSGYGFGYGGFGYNFGYGGDPYFDVDQVNRYTSTVEVVMGHGPKPPTPRAYDAHAVIAHLQGVIQYPEVKGRGDQAARTAR